MQKPFGWPLMFFNAKAGSLTDPALRRAVVASLSFEDMLAASFGSTDFYEATGAFYPEGYAFHTEAGAESYTEGGDPEAAQELAEEAGYDGQPIRIMVSKQYDFHFKMAQVAAEYMRAAGFEVDLQVLDWATLLQRRNDAGLWEIFFTHGPILPEPTLYSFMTSAAPGWWATPARDQAVAAFNAEPDPEKRAGHVGRPPDADLRGGAGRPRRQLQRACRPRQCSAGRAAGGVALLLEHLAGAIGLEQ